MITIIQTACSSDDAKLIIAALSALFGLAGWAAFFTQRATLKRLQDQDIADWKGQFYAYRDPHLTTFSQLLTRAYSSFNTGNGAPHIWEAATNSARWPKDLPLPNNHPLVLWPSMSGIGLDAEDRYLMNFAQKIYSPFNTSNTHTLETRSILSPSEFEKFHEARRAIAHYFDLCGTLRQKSKEFAEFLESPDIRGQHYMIVKMIAYLEIALDTALGSDKATGPGKLGLFHLGNHWCKDDRRS